MKYGDEDIIRQRLEASAKKRHSIENVSEIDGIKYIFARREFAYGFSIVAPKSFHVMPIEIAKRKFPREDRPEIILSGEDFKVCIAFSSYENQTKDLSERLQLYRSFSKRLHPSDVFFSENIYTTPEGVQMACYDYRYPVIDNDLYNLSFFTDILDKELFGWFLCPIKLRSAWEPLVRQMIQSIKIEQENEIA